MPFISSSEAKNAYFMSGEATQEIYTFSRFARWKKNGIFITKFLIFFLLHTILSVTDFLL